MATRTGGPSYRERARTTSVGWASPTPRARTATTPLRSRVAGAWGASPPGRRSRHEARIAASAGSIRSLVAAARGSGRMSSTRGKRAPASRASHRVQGPTSSTTWVAVRPTRAGRSRGRTRAASSGTGRTRAASDQGQGAPPRRRTWRPSVAATSAAGPRRARHSKL